MRAAKKNAEALKVLESSSDSQYELCTRYPPTSMALVEYASTAEIDPLHRNS